MPDETHARFLRSASPLLVVARETTGDNIAPAFVASLHDRNHMIEGEILRGTFLSTILTSVVVTRVNIGPAELNVLESLPGFDVFQQPQDAGKLNREADAANFAVVLRQNLDLPLEQQGQGALPGDDVERFVRCVEN